MKCTYCNGTNLKETNYNHVVEIKNHVIKFTKPRLICGDCKKINKNELLDEQANLELIRLYNMEYGIPKEKIVELRKSFNLSQELFAKIIGCAKKTLVSYETGSSIPNDIYMGVLKLLINHPEYIRDIIEANQDNLTEAEYDQIISRITVNQKETSKDSLGYLDDLIIYLADNGIAKTKVILLIYLIAKKINKIDKDLAFTFKGNLPYSVVLEDAIANLIVNNKLELVYDVQANKEMYYIKSKQKSTLASFDILYQEVVTKVIQDNKLYNIEQIRSSIL